MLNFSANLSFLFQELPMADRYAAAAKAGFKAVEFMFPQDIGLDRVKRSLKDAGVSLQLFNLRAGNWLAGERGLACLSGRDDEFAATVHEAAEYAVGLSVPRVNCLCGLLPDSDISRAEDLVVERLRYAADQFAQHNLTLLIENINRFDMPGFFVSTTARAFRIMDRVGADNLKLQYDIYHAQRMEGELIATLEKRIDRIGHIQIADNPGRHQPGTGEICYSRVLRCIEKLNYQGWVGLEYIPSPTTLESFDWMEEFR